MDSSQLSFPLMSEDLCATAKPPVFGESDRSPCSSLVSNLTCVSSISLPLSSRSYLSVDHEAPDLGPLGSLEAPHSNHVSSSTRAELPLRVIEKASAVSPSVPGSGLVAVSGLRALEAHGTGLPLVEPLVASCELLNGVSEGQGVVVGFHGSDRTPVESVSPDMCVSEFARDSVASSRSLYSPRPFSLQVSNRYTSLALLFDSSSDADTSDRLSDADDVLVEPCGNGVRARRRVGRNRLQVEWAGVELEKTPSSVIACTASVPSRLRKKNRTRSPSDHNRT